MPDETMYSAEKSPMIAKAREEVTFDAKDAFKKKSPDDLRLIFVLSLKNYRRYCGNHIISCNHNLKSLFFGLEFNIPGSEFGHPRRSAQVRLRIEN